MIIYYDLLTKTEDNEETGEAGKEGDELISDAYNLKLVDDVVYEADCAIITEGEVKVDTGANASAEDAEDRLDQNPAVRVNNIVQSFRLQSTHFDRNSYRIYIKDYFKRITAHREKAMRKEGKDEAAIAKATDDFKNRAGGYASRNILPKNKFGEFDFFTGESMNPDGMVVLLRYREDGTTPYVTIWKDGLYGKKY
ncbi:hypothetical protein QQZ08_001615 [Neonectria magnoliae]|uniref:Translationally-controlled tumor protein homolog n=1 Tax=Neonectria magnoliae TaxID=2732573 RepID=A0ABR1IFJ5_9HYPO